MRNLPLRPTAREAGGCVLSAGVPDAEAAADAAFLALACERRSTASLRAWLRNLGEEAEFGVSEIVIVSHVMACGSYPRCMRVASMLPRKAGPTPPGVGVAVWLNGVANVVG